MISPALLPAPRRITSSNLPLGGRDAAGSHSEPGVEVLVDTLQPEPILGGALMRTRVASSKKVPTSNDGHGRLELDEVPGMGIVLPGGLNVYYLDVAPQSEGVMHRTTSTDYVFVLQGTPSLLTPPNPFDVVDGQGTYGEPTETICKPGDTIIHRGVMHALSNRTDEWVRLMGVVVSSEQNRVRVEQVSGSVSVDKPKTTALNDAWLQ